jgi:hypothetical protein
MLENTIQEMYDPKKEEINLTLQMQEKGKLFDFIYHSMIHDRILAVGTGIVGVLTGISAISEMQPPDSPMLNLYIGGTLMCLGASVYSSISAYNKNKQLRVLGKEMDKIEDNPLYKDKPIIV